MPAVCLWFSRCGERVKEGGEGDTAPKTTEDEASGGQNSLLTPSENKRRVRQHLPHYRLPPPNPSDVTLLTSKNIH